MPSTSSPARRLHLVDNDDGAQTALIAGAKAGDPNAWSQLYARHCDALLRSTAYLTGDVTLAEDLVQEAFSQAFVAMGRFEPNVSFLGWMRGICRNLVYKSWRKNARRGAAHDRLEQLGATLAGQATDQPDDMVVTRIRAQALFTALETLSPPLREAFVLRDVEGLSAADAGRLSGTSERNVRVRATRARARLRRELVRHGLVEEEPA